MQTTLRHTYLNKSCSIYVPHKNTHLYKLPSNAPSKLPKVIGSIPGIDSEF